VFDNDPVNDPYILVSNENMTIVPAAGQTISRMWNDGLDRAEKMARSQGVAGWNVAILNNDLDVDPGFLTRLARAIRADDSIWLAYPNHHGLDLAEGQYQPTASDAMAGQTMSGWAFMVRGEVGVRVDEQFRFWFTDADLERQVRRAGKLTVCVGGCHARHLQPMESSKTPQRLAQAKADEFRFAAKWNVDPVTLWLSNHPEFGQ